MLKNFYLSMALFLSMFIVLFLACITWKRRKIPIAFKLSMIMLATSIYMFGYAYEVTLTDLEGIKFCLLVEYHGIPFIPVLLLIMIFDYTGLIIKKSAYLVLFIIPVVTLILQYTNDWHHLFYKSLDFVNGNELTLVYIEKGPWYWIHLVYSYLSIGACIISLVIKYVKESGLHRIQILVLGLGICIPWIFNLAFLVNVKKNLPDLTPFGLVFSAILLTLAIYRLNLLKVTPIAFEKVVQFMSEAIIILDNRDQIIHYNDPAVNIIPELKVIKTDHNNYENVFNKYPAIKDILCSDLIAETRFRVYRNGILGVYTLKLTYIYNKDYMLGKILVLSDITACERNMENLTAASAQLSALNTLKDRLISIVASDIREPLDMLINLSDLLKNTEVDTEIKHELISEIQKHISCIYLRIDNMLEYFQNKQNSIIYSPMDWNLSSLVEEAIKPMLIKAEIKSISVECHIEDNITVYADKGMLDIVLKNIMSNAVKFTHRYGSITVAVEKEESFIIISVKDTGVGIEEEKVQMLFQDVEASPASGTEGEVGIGLGLLLCRHIIKRNYGDIWVDSTIGEGSNFFISIPASGENYR